MRTAALLLAKIISEVCNSVGWVADELGLSLSAMEFLAIDVRKDSGDLAV